MAFRAGRAEPGRRRRGQRAQGGAQQRVGAELAAGTEAGAARGPSGAGRQETGRGGKLAQGVGAGIQGELDRVHVGEPAGVAAQTRMTAPGIAADVEPDLVGALPPGQRQREHTGQHLLRGERETPGQVPGDPLGLLLVQDEAGLVQGVLGVWGCFRGGGRAGLRGGR